MSFLKLPSGMIVNVSQVIRAYWLPQRSDGVRAMTVYTVSHYFNLEGKDAESFYAFVESNAYSREGA